MITYIIWLEGYIQHSKILHNYLSRSNDIWI